jgi:hypothetical protein
MGNSMSAEERNNIYTAWEQKYVTIDHNGTTACLRGMPIDPAMAAYVDVPIIEGTPLPNLLHVHGVWNVVAPVITWAAPTTGPGRLLFRKVSMTKDPGSDLCLTVDVPAGSTRVDMGQYRALFVAYLDTLTILVPDLVELPGSGNMLTLSSRFTEQDPGGSVAVHGVSIGPNGIEPLRCEMPARDLAAQRPAPTMADEAYIWVRGNRT